MLNIPNIVTLIRVLLIPFFVVTYYLPFGFHYIVAAIIFAVASLTDWLDGYLARKLRQETRFGAFCDPLADKLIVIIALMLIVSQYNSLWVTIPAIIIVSREVIISGLREWMAKQGVAETVAVIYVSKVKTTMQMLAIIILLVTSSSVGQMDAVLMNTGIGLLILAAILSLYTMLIYLTNSWRCLN